MIFLFFSFLSVICFSKNIYNETLAQQLWKLTRMTYCLQPNDTQSWNKLRDFAALSITDTNSYECLSLHNFGFSGYLKNDNLIFLAFRGTHEKSIKNWMENLLALKKNFNKCRNCQVHLGFDIAFQNLGKNRIIQDLKNLRKKYPSAQLAITGHSLGSAIATIAAAEMCDQISGVDHLYTFGSPRVGDQNFANYMMKSLCFKNLFRITYKSDPVIKLPFKLWFPLPGFGFAHLFPEVYYKNGSRFICETENEDSCSETVKWDDINLSDHGINFGMWVCSHVGDGNDAQ